MPDIATSLFTGLSSAALLFMVAAGLTLIFGALRVINIAHGSFYMLGGYLLFELTSKLSIPVWLAAPLAAIGIGILGVAVERLIMRFTYNRDHLIQLLATFALLLVFADLALMIWGTTTRSVPSPAEGSFSFLGMELPTYRTIVIFVAIAVGVGLWALLNRTRLGWMIRGSSEDPVTLQALGYDVPLLNTFVFGLSGALAGLGGAIYAPMGSVGPGLDTSILVQAFVVTIVGGLGSILGAAITAVIIGVLNGIVVVVIPELSSSLLFIIMIVTLVIRPWGLFGKPEK